MSIQPRNIGNNSNTDPESAPNFNILVVSIIDARAN